MRCSYCGSKEHNVEACPKTWGGNAARAWHPESVADHFVEDRKYFDEKWDTSKWNTLKGNG